ncbi:unnamed protein product [Pseudo-nitzschia multistriata]|uniref:DUF6824 domain-containing protein n=1 Tax=Pseudo-nitzschia multistriata TaxID=183589 RepID=A0A448ZA73_9STRA|nr:unnamed protein product [Pseudo-nitzschia multistriata]
MKGISEPCQRDILCGRGGKTLRYPGNLRYRSLIRENKTMYLLSSKEQKSIISRSIVAAIRARSGRFLEQATDKTWYDVGDAKAIEKTAQALREGQAKLRRRIIDSGLHKEKLGCSRLGAPHITFASLELPFKHEHSRPNQIAYVSDSPSINVHKMNDEIFQLRQPLDTIITPGRETIIPLDHPQPHYHHQAEIRRNSSPVSSLSNISIPFGNYTANCPHRQNYSTIIPQVNRILTSTVQLNQPIHDVPQPLLFPCNNERQEDVEQHKPVPDFVGDNNDDENSIMTFEMDRDEFLEPNECLDILPLSVSRTPITNHLRSVRRWNSSAPNAPENNYCYHHLAGTL